MKMTSMLAKVSLLLYLLFNAGDYVSALQDTVDIDNYFEASFKCFWHMICTMNETLRIKNAADQMPDTQIKFVLTDLVPNLEEHLRIIKSVEDFRRDDFWLNVYAIQGCEFSIEDREKLLSGILDPFMDHFREICYDEERLEQCEAVGLSSSIYQELEKEMVLRKECNLMSQPKLL